MCSTPGCYALWEHPWVLTVAWWVITFWWAELAIALGLLCWVWKKELTPHARYAKYLVRHKWFVFQAGLRNEAPLWRLVIHDWSKLMPCEWFPYVEQFYGEWRTRAEKYPTDDAIHRRFDAAWLHHQHANPHHWQHWVLREDSGKTKLLRMPHHFVREMVSDWCGAGRAITGKWDVTSWYEKNAANIQLHPDTERAVAAILGEW